MPVAYQLEKPANVAAERANLAPVGKLLQHSPGRLIPNHLVPSIYREHRSWSSKVVGYLSAFTAISITLLISIALTSYEMSFDLSLLVIAALLVSTWMGGLGPGILVAVVFELVNIFSNLPTSSSSLEAYVFSHVSVLSLYVFLVLLIGARRNAERHIKEQREWLIVTLSSISDGVIAADTTGVITFINPIAEDLTGWGAVEAVGKRVDEVLVIKDGKSGLPASDDLSLAARRDNIHSDHAILVMRSGREIVIDDKRSSITAADGTIVGVVSVFHDISERKQAEMDLLDLTQTLEDRVAKRTSQLQAVNDELEAFSYSVSHDLRAPLRQINGFSQALFEEQADALSDEGRLHLSEIQSASHDMTMLIDDLLQLSRVTRSDMRREEVDLSSLARGVVDSLKKREKGRVVNVAIEPSLSVVGDRRLLGIALTNLIGNAWKFTSHREAPTINVGRRIVDGVDQFFVRDDGAGFDMACREKLFQAFQRLHSTKEFEGTGIGLATVQRVIRRHGGRVWAEGEKGKGATFYFSLPCVRPSKTGDMPPIESEIKPGKPIDGRPGSRV